MYVSLRSQLIAGTAALGAAVIAISPVAQPDLLPALNRVSAEVQLSALSLVNPITAVGAVVEDLNTDIFSQAFVSQDLVWGDYFTNPPAYDLLYAPLNLGIIPDFGNQLSTGALVGLVNNLSGYTWAGIRGVGVVGAGAAAALFNTPIAVLNAVQLIAAGNPQGALDVLKTQILGPLKQGIQGLGESVGYILDNAIRNVKTVLGTTTPTLLKGVIDSVANGTIYVVKSALATVVQVVKDITTLNIQAAWNDSVNGFLSKNGTLGQLEQLTAGIGIVATDTTVTPAYDYVAIPSTRSVVTSVLQRTGDYASLGQGGITNAPFAPTPGPVASVKLPSAASVTRSAAAVAAAPATEAAPGDTSAAGSAPSLATPTAGVDATTVASDASAVTSGETAAATPANGSASAPKAPRHGASRKGARAASSS